MIEVSGEVTFYPQYDRVLEFASDERRNDRAVGRDVVLAAVDRAVGRGDVVLAAVQQGGRALGFASDEPI